jgi:hypothetical protein
MYEERDEAILALTPKSVGIAETAAVAPFPSDFTHLTVSRCGVVTHVQFQGMSASAGETEGKLSEDFDRLADMLKINSKVLVDFADVETFSPGCINALAVFERKLRNRGSRTALCSLAPDTRACFFDGR